MSTKFPTPQERAMQWLLEATEIGGMSKPEAALYAYMRGFAAALDLAIEIENVLCEPDEPKPAPKDERERGTRIQWAKDFRLIADWLDTNCHTESEEA